MAVYRLLLVVCLIGGYNAMYALSQPYGQLKAGTGQGVNVTSKDRVGAFFTINDVDVESDVSVSGWDKSKGSFWGIKKKNPFLWEYRNKVVLLYGIYAKRIKPSLDKRTLVFPFHSFP